MEKNRHFEILMDVGVALSKEKNRRHLFNLILDSSMEICNCDGGTLYLYENKCLKFAIMKTISMNVDKGRDGEEINLPDVPLKEENICAYAAIHGTPLNIEDVGNSDSFDFSGPKKYDAMTGYKTVSMMAIPLINEMDETVGVMQLINAIDDKGKVVSFSKELEKTIFAIASQAAIALTNLQYQEELKKQMWSFTEAMAEAIDARTPYNATHTRNVARYCGMIADYVNKMHEEGMEEEYFSVQRREQLVMGAYLHDIGKMVIPLEVMNKATRLNGKETIIESRLENYGLRARLQYMENKISEEELKDILSKLEEALIAMKECNAVGYLNKELENKLRKTLQYVYVENGQEYPFFIDKEKEDMLVVKGTLTKEEREIMESHVVMTDRILSKVHFIKYFQDSPKWAVEHHETLNGKGYPKRLGAEDLRLESRIIAVADVCDALLATDRPYKKPIPKEKAFDIMKEMADSGALDGRVVKYLEACI